MEEALNRIYNMNCIEGMERLYKKYGSFVDCMITDPPYNISQDNNFKTMGRKGIDFGEWDKNFDLTSWLDSADKLLKPGANVIIFNDWKNMSYLKDKLESLGYLIKQMVIWRKTSPMPRNRDRLYVTSCEFAIWATKGKGWTFNRQRENYENAIFDYATVSPTKRIHPTEKPTGLLKDLLKIHTNAGDICLEPFAGSASLPVSALELDRKFIGFELDRNHYNTATGRIQEVIKHV
jgi:site-specific DNA-methyltransferase (adenine-specific)